MAIVVVALSGPVASGNSTLGERLASYGADALARLNSAGLVLRAAADTAASAQAAQLARAGGPAQIQREGCHARTSFVDPLGVIEPWDRVSE
jgi:cytidylate kinase